MGGTARGRRCLCQGDGVCLLFTVEGPEEGCGGRKKTSKDGSAITGLCAATNHSCHVNRPLKRPIFLPLKNWNVPVITWQNFPPLPLPPVSFLSRYRSSYRSIVFSSRRVDENLTRGTIKKKNTIKVAIIEFRLSLRCNIFPNFSYLDKSFKNDTCIHIHTHNINFRLFRALFIQDNPRETALIGVEKKIRKELRKKKKGKKRIRDCFFSGGES